MLYRRAGGAFQTDSALNGLMFVLVGLGMAATVWLFLFYDELYPPHVSTRCGVTPLNVTLPDEQCVHEDGTRVQDGLMINGAWHDCRTTLVVWLDPKQPPLPASFADASEEVGKEWRDGLGVVKGMEETLVLKERRCFDADSCLAELGVLSRTNAHCWLIPTTGGDASPIVTLRPPPGIGSKQVFFFLLVASLSCVPCCLCLGAFLVVTAFPGLQSNALQQFRCDVQNMVGANRGSGGDSNGLADDTIQSILKSGKSL